MSAYDYAEKLISSGEVAPNVAPLSRRMKISYVEAAHIIDLMEEANFISKPNLIGKRELLHIQGDENV